MRRATKRATVLLGAAAGLSILSLVVGVPIWNMIDTRRSAGTNAPAIEIPRFDLPFIGYPDATHIRLRDGRTFRLAYLEPPDPGTPEYAAAITVVEQTLSSGSNLRVGLQPVGTSPDGETIVELRGFHRSLGGCGSMGWAERRRASIPRWKPLTWKLVGNGHFALTPGAPDSEAVGFERYARENAQGIWSNAIYLKRLGAVARAESVLGPDKEKHTLSDHRTAATILLRADPERYAPRLMNIVRDATRKDAHFRATIAIALDQAGYPDGTIYLIDALRGTVRSGLDEHDLNSVVGNYVTHWNIAGRVGFGDEAGLVAYFDSTIRPRIPSSFRPTTSALSRP